MSKLKTYPFLILLLLSAVSQCLFGQIASHRVVSQPGFSTFEPNVGQWPEAFQNKLKLGYGNLFTDSSGYKIMLWSTQQTQPMMEEFHLHKDLINDYTIDFCGLHFNFLDANTQAFITYKSPATWFNGYYYGNNSENWAPKVKPYYEVYKKDIYPNVHFLHSSMGDYAKTEWHVQPKGNPQNIQIEIKGQDSLAIVDKNLVIYTPAGNLVEKAPVAWQMIEGSNSYVSVAFKLEKNVLSFELGKYNPNYPLVIDPLLVFSTYSGSVSDNFGFTATYNSKGELYAGGISNDINGSYPVTAGAFQKTYKGGNANLPVNLPCDIAISKYSSDGTTLLYATYLGDSLNDFPHSLVVNNKDELYILGTTFSRNFPTKNGYDSTYNGNADIILVHFNEDCSQLLHSTFIGGSNADGLNAPLSANTLGYNYADDFRGDIVTDSFGNVYVATCTNSTNFPTSDSASQKTKAAGRDAIIFSLDSTLKKLRFSTFWGGSSDDAAYSIKINSSGSVYVGGGTASTNFPSKGNVYQNTYQGGRADGFVLKLDSTDGKIEKSSFYGTAAYDQCYFIDIDLKNRVYLAGQTEGNITRTIGTYGKDNTSQFVAALDSGLNSVEFQTTFGNRTNNPELSPSAFLVDNCYNIYFSGWGSNIGSGHAGTTAGLQVKNPTWAATDGNDFYLLVMNKEAKGIIYASYIGGTGSDDHVDGGTSRFDKNGIVYQSVCASCPPAGISQLSDFPTTPLSAFPNNPSIRCSNASFKLDFQISYFTEARFNNPNRFCQGVAITFNNTGKGTTFNWDFGDGNTDTARNPTHLYKAPGNYTVTLYAIDSLACNLADTFERQIEILNAPKAGFSATFDPCKKGIVSFTNNSDATDQIWSFGDGDSSNTFKPEHNYLQDGVYKVQQIVALSNGCQDTATQTITLASNAGGALTLYNVFTPNSTDELNKCWVPDGINTACEEVEIFIYNRYGTRVFNSKTDGGCWNGKIANKGAETASGTYYYALFVKRKDKNEERKVYGVITLIR